MLTKTKKSLFKSLFSFNAPSFEFQKIINKLLVNCGYWGWGYYGVTTPWPLWGCLIHKYCVTKYFPEISIEQGQFLIIA